MKQLHKFGWRKRHDQTIVVGGKQQQVVYRNKAQAAELNRATKKNKQPTKKAREEVKSPKVPSVESPKLPSAESIIDCDRVVLEFDNSHYKKVMYEQFRSMSGTKIKMEVAALKVLDQLKSVALHLSRVSFEPIASGEKHSSELFRFDRSEWCLCVAKDEEALKGK